MAYEVRIVPSAERAIAKLPERVQSAVLDKLEELGGQPYPPACEKVAELARYGVFRIRVEKSYRILYQVKEHAAVVLVVKVADRKEVYRRLDELKRYLA